MNGRKEEVEVSKEDIFKGSEGKIKNGKIKKGKGSGMMGRERS